VLLEDHVGVDAAEPEGVDAGPAGAGPGPRLGLGDEPKPGLLDQRVRVFGVQGGREHPVVDGQRRFGQPGQAAGGHGVADHRLDGAQAGAPLAHAQRTEHLAQAVELGLVARGGGGAVGLDQADRAGVEPGDPPGHLHGGHLTGGVGAHQAGGPTVRRQARAPDDGVDAIVVTLGVDQALEDEEPGALTHHDAVGPAAERPDLLAGRQGVELGEDRVEGGVVAVVGGARQDHVTAAGGQLVAGVVDGDEGRGAGRVDDEGGPLEVEAVGDARRRQVGHQADRRLGPVGPELADELGSHLLEAVAVQAGQQGPQRLDQLLGDVDAGVDARRARAAVRAPAHDHPDAVGCHPLMDLAAVGQGRSGLGEAEELVGLAEPHGQRHDAEGGGIEAGHVVDEPAPLAVEAVDRGGPPTPAVGPRAVGRGGARRGGPRDALVAEDRVPPARGHVGDGVDAVAHVAPQVLERGRAGEDAAHAHDGDGLHVELTHVWSGPPA
jgi:hypothetical protein